MPRADHTVTVDDVDDVADETYRDLNRANWDARVPLHAVSEGYGLSRYRRDPERLSDVVTFDLPLLGDVAGLDSVHLQCHIGTDTLSLHRLGARVTGLDFSGPALEVARALAAECRADIDYVESDVYDAVEALGGARFDLVYTGIGALCWLPSVMQWAEVVAGLLRPGGRLFIREGHPVLWTLDDPRPDGEVVIRYPYFEGPGVEFDEAVTYVDHDGEIEATRTIEFNHGLGEIITALQLAGLEFVSLTEHDSVPWAALGDQMEERPGGEFRLIDRPERLPHSYTLRALRR
jgi:2-polyprenyl-3-methyl-5-hydroxy-6-metoxy-1,4-benzoquinol methylase